MDEAAESKSKYRAPALEKGLDILELLSSSAGPMTLSQICGALGRSLNELFRMIQVLELRGYLESTPQGYRLTNRLFTLGLKQPPTKSLLEAANTAMRELTAVTFHACHLVVPSGDDIVVIHRVESPGDLGYLIRVGYRRPIIEATSGLVLFALASEARQNELLRRLQEKHAGATLDRFIADAAEVAQRGYAVRQSDFVRHVTDVCAPITTAEGAVATLNTPFIEHRPPSLGLDATVLEVRRAAAAISGSLVGGPLNVELAR